MSTQQDTEMKDHLAVVYWGGNDKGAMIQITKTDGAYLQFDLSEASALINTLSGFITGECERRQLLLKKQIADLKIAEKTIFEEVANLPRSLLEVPMFAVRMVDQWCPKHSFSNDPTRTAKEDAAAERKGKDAA